MLLRHNSLDVIGGKGEGMYTSLNLEVNPLQAQPSPAKPSQ